MTNSELKEKLVDVIGLLSIPGIGRGRYNKLVRIFGSPSAVLHASTSQLETVNGISSSLAKDIKTGFDGPQARQVAARIVQLGWKVLMPDDVDYPAPLLNVPERDMPPILFARGDITIESGAIAIVGTRRPTEDGRSFAHNLAGALARAGLAVVSGMAEGIDSWAHKGALEAGGRTIAVWGSSLDIVYPPSNKHLASLIENGGGIISEYFPQTSPDKAHFPERNRIISGLSDGVVVIEAGRKSGALITAEQALSQGRELFAVPGKPGAKMSEGANELIKRGARLLTSVDDIFEELPRLKGQVSAKKFVQLPDMTDIEKNIIVQFQTGPQQIDELARTVGLSVSEIMEYLLALELKGVVRELSGKRFVLSEEYA